MAEYKVKHVLPDPPKEWNGPHGTIYYIEVMVEGHDKPLSVGKKDPKSLKEGDTIYGDIIPTDYLSDKWKPSPPPVNASKPDYDSAERGEAITASMVVKIAFQAFLQSEGMLPQEDKHWRQIDYMADMLKRSIDKVKGDKEAEPTKEPLPLEDLNVDDVPWADE